MAQRQAAQASQQLQQGVSPGVRASGPFAKTIAQAQQGLAARGQKQKPSNFTFQQRPNASLDSAMKTAAARPMR